MNWVSRAAASFERRRPPEYSRGGGCSTVPELSSSLTLIDGGGLQRVAARRCILKSLRCPAQTDQAAKALAGRHGKSGGTDVGAPLFWIALAPLSYDMRPPRGAFFCSRSGPMGEVVSTAEFRTGSCTPAWSKGGMGAGKPLSAFPGLVLGAAR